jgi:hypothetical protein
MIGLEAALKENVDIAVQQRRDASRLKASMATNIVMLSA